MAVIQYGIGGSVEIRGNASQLVKLDTTAPVRVAWEPVDKRVLDLEVRVSFQQIPGMPSSLDQIGAPFVRWSMQTGHGTSIIEEPPQTFPLKPGSLEAFGNQVPKTIGSLMPGRGLHFRTTARDCAIILQNTGFLGVGYGLRDGTYAQEILDGPAVPMGDYLEEMGYPTVPSFPTVVLSVSFQPVEGLDVPIIPKRSNVDPYTQEMWGNYVPFPAAANEWRVYDESGRMVDPGYDETVSSPTVRDRNDARLIRLVDPVAAAISDASVLPNHAFEWLPIPLRAWALFRRYPYAGETESTYNDAKKPFNVEFR